MLLQIPKPIQLINGIPLLLLLVVSSVFGQEKTLFNYDVIGPKCYQSELERCPIRVSRDDGFRACQPDCGIDYCFGDFFEKKTRWNRICNKPTQVPIKLTNSRNNRWTECGYTDPKGKGISGVEIRPGDTQDFVVWINPVYEGKIFVDNRGEMSRAEMAKLACENKASKTFTNADITKRAFAVGFNNVRILCEVDACRFID